MAFCLSNLAMASLPEGEGSQNSDVDFSLHKDHAHPGILHIRVRLASQGSQGRVVPFGLCGIFFFLLLLLLLFMYLCTFV